MFSHKKHAKTHRTKKLFSLVNVMKMTRLNLMCDLADSHMISHFSQKERGDVYPVNDGCPPYPFKKIAQLRDFDKRIIWPDDESFESLTTKSFKDFVDSQEGFNLPEPINRRELLVIQRAAEICQSILGEFSYDRWFDLCSFGKRAALGLPRSKAYLDERFNCLSGTPLQVAAFKHALSRDIHLFRGVRKRCRSIKVEHAIKLSAVPKSWKTARVIAPDTILGGFLSRGLGDYIRSQLEKNTRIDLALQQERHKRWAQDASRNGSLATIDMSKASDSFVWRHIELIVPKSWHHALDIVRTPKVDLGDKVMPLKSYMLMGSGHTFPLQTLLFYCLAEATRTLLKQRGFVSVYGDDIIVPVYMSSHLIIVLSSLGFKVNSSKSFFDMPDPDRPSHTFFRESCGGDYKGGIDVRPYMPECNLQEEGDLPRNEIIAWCHRMINGLLDRWSFEEIPQTVLYLLRSINEYGRRIVFVPSYETSHAGITHDIPPLYTKDLECSYVKYENSFPTYWRLTFTQVKRKRQVEERPYLWYAYFLASKKKGVSDQYGTPISLTGEPNRSKKGTYRWKLRNQSNWS